MTKKFTDSEIWTKDWFLDLDDKQKLLTKFIFDNCDCAGIYEISWRMMKIFFTSEITKDDFEKIKQVKFIDDNTIFVEDYVCFQCGIDNINMLNPNNNAHKGVIKRLKKYNLYLAPSEPLVSPLIGAQEKEKEKEEEEEKEKDTEKEEEEKLQNDCEVEIECYGEYLNVALPKGSYGKLLAITQSKEFLDEVIDDFGVNIRTGKEQPYKNDLPYAHYERLRAYIKQRRKSVKAEKNGVNTGTIADVSAEDIELLTKHFKDKENPSGYVRYLISNNDHIVILDKIKAEQKRKTEKSEQTSTYVPAWKQADFVPCSEEDYERITAKFKKGKQA